MKILIEKLLEMTKKKTILEQKMIEIYESQQTIKNIQKNIRTLNYEVKELQTAIEGDYIQLAIKSGWFMNDIKENPQKYENEFEQVFDMLEEKMIVK